MAAEEGREGEGGWGRKWKRREEVAMMNERPPRRKRSKIKLPNDMCPSSLYLVAAPLTCWPPREVFWPQVAIFPHRIRYSNELVVFAGRIR